MKNLVVTGMLILSTSIASAATKSVREQLTDYTKVAREALYGGKGKTAASLDKASQDMVKNKIAQALNMPSIKTVMSGPNGPARMDHLVTIVAAKKMSAELIKNGETASEGKSIDAAADATAKLLVNLQLMGEKPSRDLNGAQVAEVKEALNKLESLTTEIITKYSIAERDSYTKILQKYDQLNSTSNKSAEENFVDAIMTVKNIDRTQALELAKKLNKC